MLVNSDLTLRAQLTEFKDHKLLRMRRTPDGTEAVHIPLENSLLEEFVVKYEDGMWFSLCSAESWYSKSQKKNPNYFVWAE